MLQTTQQNKKGQDITVQQSASKAQHGRIQNNTLRIGMHHDANISRAQAEVGGVEVDVILKVLPPGSRKIPIGTAIATQANHLVCRGFWCLVVLS